MSFAKLLIGKKVPEILNVAIELPPRTSSNYEYDVKLDETRLERPLHSAVFDPFDYGFIAKTKIEDDNHLDIPTLITQPTYPDYILEVRPVGFLTMSDQANQDWKILAPTYNKDPTYAALTKTGRC